VKLLLPSRICSMYYWWCGLAFMRWCVKQHSGRCSRFCCWAQWKTFMFTLTVISWPSTSEERFLSTSASGFNTELYVFTHFTTLMLISKAYFKFSRIHIEIDKCKQFVSMHINPHWKEMSFIQCHHHLFVMMLTYVIAYSFIKHGLKL